MEANYQPANRVQVKIVNTMWERSAPALAIVPLAAQGKLAVATLALGFAFLAVFLMNRSKLGLASSAAASVFLAFGAVFLVNAVRVYTG